MTAATAAAPLAPASPSGKTIGIIAGIAAGLVVLGVGGYFGYRMLFPSETSSHVATSDAPASTPAMSSASEPAKDVMPAPQPPVQDAVSMQSAPPKLDSEAKPMAKDATATGDAAAAKAAAAKMDPSKAAPTKAAPTGVPGSPPTTLETPGAPGAVALGKAPTVPTAQPDRWKEMREAMARCAGDNFFKRVACEQSVGQQYCEGFWGKVPQCPSGPPAKERGQ